MRDEFCRSCGTHRLSTADWDNVCMHCKDAQLPAAAIRCWRCKEKPVSMRGLVCADCDRELDLLENRSLEW